MHAVSLSLSDTRIRSHLQMLHVYAVIFKSYMCVHSLFSAKKLMKIREGAQVKETFTYANLLHIMFRCSSSFVRVSFMIIEELRTGEVKSRFGSSSSWHSHRSYNLRFEDQMLEDQTLEDQTLENQTLEDQTLEDQTFAAGPQADGSNRCRADVCCIPRQREVMNT